MTRKRYKKLMTAYLSSIPDVYKNGDFKGFMKYARILTNDNYIKEQIPLYRYYDAMLLSIIAYSVNTPVATHIIERYDYDKILR